MEQVLVGVLEKHGVWALLFVGVLAWFLREIRNMHREQLAAKDEEIGRLMEENARLIARDNLVIGRFSDFIDKMADKAVSEK